MDFGMCRKWKQIRHLKTSQHRFITSLACSSHQQSSNCQAAEFSWERRSNLPLNIAHKPGCADSVWSHRLFSCVRVPFVCPGSRDRKRRNEFSSCSISDYCEDQLPQFTDQLSVNCPGAVAIIVRVKNYSRLHAALARRVTSWIFEQQIHQIFSLFLSLHLNG